jgi:arylsulfatase
MTEVNNKNRFNCLLITVDALRADFLGVYNPDIKKENISETIDKWAESGFKFDRAIAQGSHTCISCLAMLSGNYASKYGDWFNMVADERLMIAEIFKKNGYNTYGINSNPYVSHYFNFDRGFDVYNDNMPAVSKKKGTNKLLTRLSRIKAVLDEPYENVEKINCQAVAQLKASKTPYFMWVHYMDVHGPYVSKKGWGAWNRLRAAYLWKKALKAPDNVTLREKEYMISCYKDEIAYLDSHIMGLLNHVDESNTVIVFTADHGDLFGEKNMYGHSRMLYNSVLHVPLILKIPNISNGKTINIPVKSMDILPTLVELLELSADCSFDGTSFLPMVTGESEEYDCEYIISEISRKHLCVEKGHWKLIVNYTERSVELYDLSNDLIEESNVVHEHPALARELEDIIKCHIENNKADNIPRKKIEDDYVIRERLKALGYM